MIRTRIAGSPHPWMIFDPEVTRCAFIDDGVAIDFSICEEPQNHHQHTGWIVIAFEDLETMYKAAKYVRDSKKK